MAISKRAAEGAKLLKDGKLAEARREFEAALAQSANDREALIGLARAHLAVGESEQAKPLLQRLLKLFPGHPESLSHLARMRAEAGDESAVDALRLIAKQETAGFPEFYNLGYVLLNRGVHEEAAQALVQALKLVPNNGQAVTYLGLAREMAGEFDEALRCYKAGANYAPNEHLPVSLGARLLVKMGQPTQAVAVMKRAIERAPKRADLRGDLIRICLFAADLDEAHKQAIDLRALDPAGVESAYLLGLVLLTRGDAANAAAAFQEAVKIAPSSWEAHLGLSKALRMTGKEGEGVQALQKAYAIAPLEPGPANELAVWHLGAPDGAAKARAILQPVLEAHPDNTDVHLNLAIALMKTDRVAAEKHAKAARASTVPTVKDQADRLLKKLIAPPLRLPIRA